MKKMLEESLDYLGRLGIGKAEVGIILGTGLGQLVERIRIQVKVPYAEIPHFPVSTVEFHKGELL